MDLNDPAPWSKKPSLDDPAPWIKAPVKAGGAPPSKPVASGAGGGAVKPPEVPIAPGLATEHTAADVLAAKPKGPTPQGFGRVVEGFQQGFGKQPLYTPPEKVEGGTPAGDQAREFMSYFNAPLEVAGRLFTGAAGAAGGAVGAGAEKFGASQEQANRIQRQAGEFFSVAPMAGAGEMPRPGIPRGAAPNKPTEPTISPEAQALIDKGHAKFTINGKVVPKSPVAGKPPAYSEITSPHIDEFMKFFDAEHKPAANIERQPQSLGAAASGVLARKPDYISEGIKGSPMAEAKTQAQADATAGVFKTTGNWFRRVFSPQSVSEASARAETTLRETRGVAEREIAIARQGLEEFQRQISALPKPDMWKLVHYMESRSRGEKIPNPALRDVAEAVRDEMEKVRGQLEALAKTAGTATRPAMNFIEDFVHHAWKDPKAAMRIFGVGKKGSGGFTKKREIPTYSEGIAKGLEPASDDLLNGMIMPYIENAYKWIGSNKAFEIGRKNGDVKWFFPHKVPDGWTKLNDMRTNFLGQDAYAPAAYSRIWNNWHDRGWHGVSREAGQAYDVIRKASNISTVAKLGFSGFHFLNEAIESAASRFGQGYGELARGHPIKGLKTFASGFAAPVEPFFGGAGTKLGEQYLNIADHGPDFRKIADLAARSNLKVVGYDKSLHGSAQGSFWNAWKRGTLRHEIVSDYAKARGGVAPAASTLFKNAGRVMDTVVQPLFQHYIPNVKRSAFYNRMKSWLDQNPSSSDADQLTFAKQLANSIDNRFGEMNQDNIFWSNTLKQTLQASMLSYSWTVGTIRELAGVPSETLGALKGKNAALKLEYVFGVVTAVGLAHAAYQYLMTGQPPQDWRDIIAPRTGGTIPADRYNPERPERAQIPTQLKDVLGWLPQALGGTGPVQEAHNKLSPFLQSADELITRKDWRGDPIDDPSSGVPGWLIASAKTILNNFVPIGVSQSQQKSKTSAIDDFQRMMGISPAGMKLADPKAYEGAMTGKAFTDYIGKLRHDLTTAQKMGDQEEELRLRQQIREMQQKKLIEEQKEQVGSGIQ